MLGDDFRMGFPSNAVMFFTAAADDRNPPRRLARGPGVSPVCQHVAAKPTATTAMGGALRRHKGGPG